MLRHNDPLIKNQGIGVPRDPDAGRKLYQEACDAGSSAAAFFLGHIFRIGDDELGITEDGVRAIELLRHASEQVRVCFVLMRRGKTVRLVFIASTERMHGAK